LAFRGIIQPTFLRVLGANETIVVTAMMFGILHLSVPSMPYLVLLGIVLGWLRQRTGSLYPCFVLHFCHNLLALLVEYWGGT
jgi:membrane protease YdiL (CAAX protease family)